MSVCTWIAPHASPIMSAHCALSFETLAAVRSTTLRSQSLWGVLIGMTYGASSAEDRPVNNSDLSRTRTATGHKKCLNDNSDLGHTHTTTGQRKRSSSQTAVQREEGLAAEQLRHIPFFSSSSYYNMYHSIYIISLLNLYSHFLRIPSLLLLIFQIHKMLHGWGARHAFAHCVCLVYKNSSTHTWCPEGNCIIEGHDPSWDLCSTRLCT